MLSQSHRPLRRGLRITLLALALPTLVCLAAGAALVTSAKGAHAEDSAADKAEASERCAIRIAIALQGKSADATLVANPDPQSAIDGMLGSPEFADRYARFINSQFNGGPATTPAEDPVYYLAKYVVAQNKPWSELFIGGYSVLAAADGKSMDVAADPNGVGYFRSPAWMKRYAGNEPMGYMLSASFRILSNTTGLTLTPSVGNPGDDRTATGRSAAPCKSCHFDDWYALDKFARLLPMKVVASDPPKFTPAVPGSQQLLGKTINDDKELLQTLVGSDPWKFAQCRNVFQFLYGRSENQCESKVFDACVDALTTTKTIQSAVAAVAKDPSFCVK